MSDFQQKQHDRYYAKLLKYKDLLPSLVQDYLVSLVRTSIKTQADYSYTLFQFFKYLVEQNPALKEGKKKPKDVTCNEISLIRAQDINEYISFLINQHHNSTASIRKALTVLNSFFTFLNDLEIIDHNPVRNGMMPRLKEKLTIDHLDRSDMDKLLNVVSNGASLEGQRKTYHKKLSARDTAIITVFLKTGVRLSECVGLNLSDLNFEKCQFYVSRKGYSKDNKQTIYMSDLVYEALKKYVEVRKKIIPVEGDEDALFLSTQRKRISERSVQRMVKKYAKDLSCYNDKVSPHTLRRSYGTALYEETNDIYLVSAGLNHRSIDVTAKYYASMDDERRKKAYTAL